MERYTRAPNNCSTTRLPCPHSMREGTPLSRWWCTTAWFGATYAAWSISLYVGNNVLTAGLWCSVVSTRSLNPKQLFKHKDNNLIGRKKTWKLSWGSRSQRDDGDGHHQIFVGDISGDVTEDQLLAFFKMRYGSSLYTRVYATNPHPLSQSLSSQPARFLFLIFHLRMLLSRPRSFSPELLAAVVGSCVRTVCLICFGGVSLLFVCSLPQHLIHPVQTQISICEQRQNPMRRPGAGQRLWLCQVCRRARAAGRAQQYDGRPRPRDQTYPRGRGERDQEEDNRRVAGLPSSTRRAAQLCKSSWRRLRLPHLACCVFCTLARARRDVRAREAHEAHILPCCALPSHR